MPDVSVAGKPVTIPCDGPEINVQVSFTPGPSFIFSNELIDFGVFAQVDVVCVCPFTKINGNTKKVTFIV